MLKMKTCVESEVERNLNRIPDGRKIRFYDAEMILKKNTLEILNKMYTAAKSN